MSTFREGGIFYEDVRGQLSGGQELVDRKSQVRAVKGRRKFQLRRLKNGCSPSRATASTLVRGNTERAYNFE